jgi:hypothetical protein
MELILPEEFYKLLEEENEIVDEDKCCLITKIPLEDNHIKLLCGHSFNYDAIYNEVKYNKRHNSQLRTYQIKCPYCRNIQNEILPLIGEYSMYGVNAPDKYTMKPNVCSYVFKSGVKKGECCNKRCYKKMCKGHLKYLYQLEKKEFCKHKLISGKNKGKECGCKIFQDGLCKRHHKHLEKH